jgi:hypothetical protein
MARLRLRHGLARASAVFVVASAIACTVTTSTSSNGPSGSTSPDASLDEAECVLPARTREGCASEPICGNGFAGDSGTVDSAATADSAAPGESNPQPALITCYTGTRQEFSETPVIGGRSLACTWTEGATVMTCRCGTGTDPTASNPDGGSELVTFEVPQTVAPTASVFDELWRTRCCGPHYCAPFQGGGPHDAPVD